MTQKAPESEKTKERKSILRAEKALEKAAELGDAAGVKKALGDLSELRVFFVDLRDDRGRTPLMAAAMSGSEESVRALLNACGVNARDVNEATALMMAAERGHLEIVKILAEKSNVRALNRYGETAMNAAFAGDHLHVVEFLERLDGFPAENAFNLTPLQSAIEAKAEKCAKFLMSRCDPNEENAYGETALCKAIEKDLPDIALALSRVSGMGSAWENMKMRNAAKVFHAVNNRAEKCLALFLSGFSWDAGFPTPDGELDVFGLMEHDGDHSDNARKCRAALAAAVPLDIGRKALKKHGGEVYPILAARVEAAELENGLREGERSRDDGETTSEPGAPKKPHKTRI